MIIMKQVRFKMVGMEQVQHILLDLKSLICRDNLRLNYLKD